MYILSVPLQRVAGKKVKGVVAECHNRRKVLWQFLVLSAAGVRGIRTKRV